MTSPHWPLTGLRLRTPGLELRWPSAADLEALAQVAADGIHDPRAQPFSAGWTDAPPGQLGADVLRYHWGRWGAWQPTDWELNLAVVADGVVVGTQAMKARDFAILREVGTGSWLGRRHQGAGIGTRMREAMLALAFDGLGAEHARSTAHEDNPASIGVSRKLGYADDGNDRLAVRSRPMRVVRFRMDRAAWLARPRAPVEFVGLEPCLAWFGAEP